MMNLNVHVGNILDVNMTCTDSTSNVKTDTSAKKAGKKYIQQFFSAIKMEVMNLENTLF